MAIRDRITEFVTYLSRQVYCSKGGIVLGRVTGDGPTQEITVGSGLTLNGTTLTANLTGGPVRSSGGTSSISNGALSIAMTSGLQSALDGKSASGHTHISVSITDAVSDASVESGFGKLLKSDAGGALALFELSVSDSISIGGAGNGSLTIFGGGNPAILTNSNAVNGLSYAFPTTAGNLAVTSRVDGMISYNDLVDVPATVPITASKVVADAAARLALSEADAEGFAVVDSDTGKSWMLVAGGTPSVSGDWLQLGDRDVQWGDVGGKPLTFAPSSHTHPLSEISQSSATSGQVPTWNGSAWAAATPSGGSFSSLTGSATDNTSLSSALDGKQSASVALLDRFDRSDRYSSPSALTHLVSTPEVGPAWRLNTSGGTPTITNGALYMTGNSLSYVGSSVPSTGGKFSLGFDFELASTTYATTGSYRGSWNVTFGSTTLIDDSGGIATGLAQNPVHITFDDIGVTSISFYAPTGAVQIPCVNAAAESSRYQWIGGGNPIAWNKRHTLVISVDGDEITVSIPGVSHLVFRHADVSTKVGSATTHWWWEPGGELQGGNQYQTIAKLYRVWSSEKLNQDPGWRWSGNLRDLAANGTHKLPGQVQLYPNNGSRLSAETLPSNVRLISGGTSTTAKGSNNRINGGHILAEGGFIGSTGLAGAGIGWGRAPLDMDMGIDAAISSIATSESTIKSFYQASSLENGDMEVVEFAGNLTGTNAKRIRLYLDAWMETAFDTDASGTPLTAVTGSWSLVVRRNVTTAASYVHSVFTANGVTLVNRYTKNFGNSDILTSLRTTTVDAGGVTLEYARRQVVRVNNN